MLVRNLGAAQAQAAAAGLIDQLPSLGAGGVFEGRAASLSADRLRFLTRGANFRHPGRDRICIARFRA